MGVAVVQDEALKQAIAKGGLDKLVYNLIQLLFSIVRLQIPSPEELKLKFAIVSLMGVLTLSGF